MIYLHILFFHRRDTSVTSRPANTSKSNAPPSNTGKLSKTAASKKKKVKSKF